MLPSYGAYGATSAADLDVALLVPGEHNVMNALGALAKEGRFATLPQSVLEMVEPRFRSPEGFWTGLSGRARVLVYNPEVTDAATLPASLLDLPTAELNGPIGWAPTTFSMVSPRMITKVGVDWT